MVSKDVLFSQMLFYETQCRMWVLYLEFSYRSKHMQIVVEIFLIPGNMSFAVLRASLLIHIRISDDIYHRKFYKYSLFIMHIIVLGKI